MTMVYIYTFTNSILVFTNYTNYTLVLSSFPTYFSLFTFGFKQLSNLFHCLLSLVFSAVVQRIATFYHRLSSVVQSISLVLANGFL